jgi:hypothetical protein
MPLIGSASVLSAAIRAALVADAANTKAVDGPALTAFCDAIATTVLAHITTNAVVVGACPPAGGPLTAGLIT